MKPLNHSLKTIIHATVLFLLLLSTGGLVAANASVSAAQEKAFTGVIVHELPVPSLLQRVTRRSVYTASPSIAVLPCGAYLITCNDFGHGSTADTSEIIYLYRSEDRGASWQLITTLSDMKRGSLWVHPDGGIYLFGFRAAPGDILIRRSLDGGYTWTEPNDERTGLLRTGTFGGTPNRHPLLLRKARYDPTLIAKDSEKTGEPVYCCVRQRPSSIS